MLINIEIFILLANLKLNNFDIISVFLLFVKLVQLSLINTKVDVDLHLSIDMINLDLLNSLFNCFGCVLSLEEIEFVYLVNARF